MEFEECRSEASIGLEKSVSTVLGEEEQCTVVVQNCSSPAGKRKRKPNSPPSSPNAIEGFGDSEAGDLLKQFPELEEIFTIVRKVGEGTFSNVYLARMKEFPDELCALKHIIPTSGPDRIENELKCLQTIGGKDNVVGIETAYRRKDHVVFVLPYVPHQKFQDYYLDMSVCEIRQYMKNLFIALKRVHSFDIIHRDIKPSNFLYSRQTKQYSLVDFGLAMQVPGSTIALLGSKEKVATPKQSSRHPPRRSSRLSPQLENDDRHSTSNKDSSNNNKTKPILKPSTTHSGNVRFASQSKSFKMPVNKRNVETRLQLESKQTASSKAHKLLCPVKHSPLEICSACMSRGHQNAPRAGTPGFRSPEVLLKCPNQTTAVDIWSGGIIMLCLLSGRYPFFRAYDDMTALAQIISVIGSSECIKTANEIGKDLILNTKSPKGDLKAACQRLRLGSSKSSTFECIALDPTERSDSTGQCTSKRARRKSPTSKNNQSNDSKIQKDMHQWCSLCREDITTGLHECLESKSIQNTEFNKDNEHLDGTKCIFDCCKCCWTVPGSAYDLLQRCLDLNPQTRISATEALEHPFFEESTKKCL